MNSIEVIILGAIYLSTTTVQLNTLRPQSAPPMLDAATAS